MRLDAARVALRPRSPWEAMELGLALVRRHARDVWRPWALATLPLFAAFNALAWSLDAMWLATLAMWWLLPLFDRIPLLVLSRAVFGPAPPAREVLAAQMRLGARGTPARLAWARFSPWRWIVMPVELLEGVAGDVLRERRRVVADGIQGHAFLLAMAGISFAGALLLSLLLLVLLFVPAQLLPESARAMWSLLVDTPTRASMLGINLALWLALSAIEPFMVGAGFGLYLARRARIEAWDIELALRRMRARLAAAAGAPLQALALALALGLLAMPSAPVAAQAARQLQEQREHLRLLPPKSQQPGERPAAQGDTLREVFGDAALRDDPAFRQAVRRAHEDPLLDRSRTVYQWEPRNPRKAERRDLPPWLQVVGRLVATVAESGLWILLGLLVLALALTARHWWPWMRRLQVAARPPPQATTAAVAEPGRLPDDLVAQARRQWREGRARRALALLYRGSVEAMAERIGVALVPGATEAQCLRASRRLPEEADRSAFARVVRVWQQAAYAGRMPGDGEFEDLLGELARRFGWAT